MAGETLSDPFWGKEFNRYRELDIMEVFEAGTVTKCKNLLLAWLPYLKKVYIFKL